MKNSWERFWKWYSKLHYDAQVLVDIGLCVGGFCVLGPPILWLMFLWFRLWLG